ncbi:MAG: hypothetical protein ACR2O3_13625 [Rhizobiaceae bacterium]
MAGKIFITGASALLIATGFALAGEARFDRKLEAAAAKIAAEKLGEIRGSIDHDKIPLIITQKLLRKEEAQSSLLPRPSWVAPKGETALPPMVSNLLSKFDYTITGSINGRAGKQSQRIIWDRFDRHGNPID